MRQCRYSYWSWNGLSTWVAVTDGQHRCGSVQRRKLRGRVVYLYSFLCCSLRVVPSSFMEWIVYFNYNDLILFRAVNSEEISLSILIKFLNVNGFHDTSPRYARWFITRHYKLLIYVINMVIGAFPRADLSLEMTWAMVMGVVMGSWSTSSSWWLSSEQAKILEMVPPSRG